MLCIFYAGFPLLYSCKLLTCDSDLLGLERPHVPSEAEAGHVRESRSLMCVYFLCPSWQESVRTVQNLLALQTKYPKAELIRGVTQPTIIVLLGKRRGARSQLHPAPRTVSQMFDKRTIFS